MGDSTEGFLYIGIFTGVLIGRLNYYLRKEL
jgi:hypothetical protein